MDFVISIKCVPGEYIPDGDLDNFIEDLEDFVGGELPLLDMSIHVEELTDVEEDPSTLNSIR